MFHATFLAHKHRKRPHCNPTRSLKATWRCNKETIKRCTKLLSAPFITIIIFLYTTLSESQYSYSLLYINKNIPMKNSTSPFIFKKDPAQAIKTCYHNTKPPKSTCFVSKNTPYCFQIIHLWPIYILPLVAIKPCLHPLYIYLPLHLVSIENAMRYQ